MPAGKKKQTTVDHIQYSVENLTGSCQNPASNPIPIRIRSRFEHNPDSNTIGTLPGSNPTQGALPGKIQPTIHRVLPESPATTEFSDTLPNRVLRHSIRYRIQRETQPRILPYPTWTPTPDTIEDLTSIQPRRS